MRPANFAGSRAERAAFRAKEADVPISEIPILSMLRTKMQWHQQRQGVLAENVSNADSPQFKPRDLAPPTFDQRAPAPAALTLARTNAAHMGGAQASGPGQFPPERRGAYEIRPTGNAVNLEDEMLKVAANQMDYQAATSLYARSLGLIKTALKR
jgi:flagellar basal-body rod protein FlgB